MFLRYLEPYFFLRGILYGALGTGTILRPPGWRMALLEVELRDGQVRMIRQLLRILYRVCMGLCRVDRHSGKM